MDHSGCTCERLRDQQNSDDDCTDSAQRMQGLEVGGGQQIVSLSTSQRSRGWGGGSKRGRRRI